MTTALLLDLGRFFSFLIIYTILDSLDGGSVRRQTSTYTEQQKQINVRFEVFTAVTMKNAVFCDVTQRDVCKNRRFGGTSGLHHQGDKNR
jgi:hypothetical protein